MFEVQDLKYATLATVSRCGMVWFSEDVLSTDMIFNNFLARIRSIPLDEGEDEAQRKRKGTEDEDEAASPMLQVKCLTVRQQVQRFSRFFVFFFCLH